MKKSSIWKVIFCSFILIYACTNRSSNYKLSDEEFTALLLDTEIAKEAITEASARVKDSLFQVYMNDIALRYDLTMDEMKNELNTRIDAGEDMLIHYRWLIGHLDSIAQSVENAQE